ncbi:hypothetical protein PMZ80_005345 [Knufia obscura]|uniref:Fork-head domain-containing protein n=2 Tax=Knufia TaxID=430999 RepID=A0AAN8ESN5_9EURO|nr:hypothetical protein PMZ80_005345 [Knufia obscura]KAK5958013.1 hypothetical protein OHC33_001203 [Knufia fluminis]
MSASVATSAVGLLDRHYSPQSVHADPNAPAWSDQMEVDRPSQERSKSREPKIAALDGAENDAQADSDRRDTIGGLLAALATNATTKSDEPSVSATTPAPAPLPVPATEGTRAAPASAPPHHSASPEAPADSPISQISHAESQQIDEEGAVNNSNNARLLSGEPMDTFPPATMPSDPAFMPPMPIDLQCMALYDEDLPMPFPPFDLPMDQFPQEPMPMREPTPVNVKRQYDAFARLEFADGIFYLNTYQCELGRDQHAYKDALRREREAQEAAELEKHQPKSSSGKASQRVQSIKAAESQVQGSVVSEKGGFAGVDDQPIEGYGDKRNGQHGKQHSSQASESSIVRPAEVLHNPSLAPFDYHKDVVYQSTQAVPVPVNDIYEDEQPAPVTADHMPDPSSCPLIPIHPTLDPVEQSEADCMKAISRRHIKIFWNWEESSFFMEVLGRNGAFFEQDHIPRGGCIKLHSGARIQISAVEFTFRLPITKVESPVDDDESSLPSDGALEASPNGTTAEAENGQIVKLKLKLNADGVASSTPPLTEGEKKARRGPGRPPKNGYMSQREMKELEKAEKEKYARTLHGGPSPPVLQPRKPSKSQLPKPEPMSEAPKPEKRKYTKRKREDGEEEEVMPSIEGQEETPVMENPLPQLTAKRARTKSFSPPYKPFAECSPEDLARPPHNYAVLLYMVLSDTGEITLRQIYKQMQSRWPYFKYVVDSDGWTSSVRHNLNQEVGKLFERGRKEGKGFTWLPKPNAMEEYQAQKNKRSNAPPAPKPRPPPQRPNFPPNQGQQLTWQNSGPMPQSNRPGETFGQQGPWPPQQPNGGRPPQPGSQTNGSMPPQPNGQRTMSSQPPSIPLNPNPNYVPPDFMLHHYFGRQAPKFIPVTFEGLAVINRFQHSMMDALPKDVPTQNKWGAIFDSAKKRCLHGAESSALEGGESNEERTIIEHVRTFVDRYKNPAFEGFDAARTASPTGLGTTPAPATVTTPAAPSASAPGQGPQAPQSHVVLPPGPPAPVNQISQPSLPPQSARATAVPVTNGLSANAQIPVSVQTSPANPTPSAGPNANSHSHPQPANVEPPKQPPTQTASASGSPPSQVHPQTVPVSNHPVNSIVPNPSAVVGAEADRAPTASIPVAASAPSPASDSAAVAEAPSAATTANDESVSHPVRGSTTLAQADSSVPASNLASESPGLAQIPSVAPATDVAHVSCSTSGTPSHARASPVASPATASLANVAHAASTNAETVVPKPKPATVGDTQNGHPQEPAAGVRNETTETNGVPEKKPQEQSMTELSTGAVEVEQRSTQAEDKNA